MIIRNCKFCQQKMTALDHKIFLGNAFDCRPCQVRYIFNNKDEIIWQSYFLRKINTTYNSLAIDFLRNKTIIWMVNKNKQIGLDPIHLPLVGADTPPQNALRLTQRLHRLLAFI